MPRLASDRLCTGCLVCVDTCKHQAIGIIKKNGLTHVSICSDKCVNCNLCEKACPIVSPVKKNDVSQMHAFGGWCKDDALRKKAASGGAFTGIALDFFQCFENSYVIGACLENNQVRHRCISTHKDLPLLMNSKYIQSDTKGIYQYVKQLLQSNAYVLFSGTPCQIAGLYGYLRKRYDQLYTVEIICHGIPGQEALDLHLTHFKSTKIISFREKEYGQYASQHTTLEINGDTKVIARKDDLFYKIFAGWLLDRKSCSNCKYASLNRVSDITIADFWGGHYKKEQFEKGVSLLIANNEHGHNLLVKTSNLQLNPSTIKEAINSNPNLYDGFKFIQYHPLVLFPNFFRKHLSRELWLRIISNQMPHKCFWAIYKILTIIHIKLKKRFVLYKFKIK